MNKNTKAHCYKNVGVFSKFKLDHDSNVKQNFLIFTQPAVAGDISYWRLQTSAAPLGRTTPSPDASNYVKITAKISHSSTVALAAAVALVPNLLPKCVWNFQSKSGMEVWEGG